MEATHCLSYFWPFVVIYPYIFPVLMCARLTASLVIDLRSFCFIPASPPASPLHPRVKCHNEGKKIPPPPSVFWGGAFVSQSNNNFVKHAKPLKSPARDLGSCAAPEPGRCKGREDPCNSVLVLPRLHTHTKPRGQQKKKSV